MKSCVAKLLLLTLALFPASALIIEPEIDFHVSANPDTLHPGDEAIFTLLIENEGKMQGFLVNENNSQLLSILTTAKDVRIELLDSYPISVENVNPQIIGDLPSGRVATANFRIKVDEEASPGEYSIPVEISYTKLYLSDSNALGYRTDQKITEHVKVKIAKKDYDFRVQLINGSLIAGKEGKVDVVIENTGEREIKEAVAVLNVSSPILPNPDGISAYIGDLKPGEKVEASFKVFVSDRALSQSYPSSLILRFSAGSQQVAMSKQIGLRVEGLKMLSITKVESFLTPPKSIQSQSQSLPSSASLLSLQTQQSSNLVTIASRGVVIVEFLSCDDMKSAVAVLSFDNPLLQPENSPYLGDIAKGEKRTAIFYVKSIAPAGSYRGTFLLKYRNELGDEAVTPQDYVEVEVKNSPISVEKVDSSLKVGLKGDLRVLIKNQLSYAISSAELYLLSPAGITTLSQSSYLTSLNTGEAKEVKFRLSVSDEAVGGYYRLILVAKYRLGEAEDLVSPIEVFAFVAPKFSAFEVLGIEGDLYPDSTGEIAIKIRNTGSVAARNAVVELQVLPPLSVAGMSSIATMLGQSQPGMYFVGTVNPGETVVAKFRIEASKDAAAGFYPATITLSFEDEDGYKQKSNPITASIEVKEKPLLNLVTITTLALVLIAIFAILRFAKRRRKS